MAVYRISLVVVGKLKEQYWRDAQAEYLKRLKNYAKIDIIEVAPEPLSATVPPAQSIELEGSRLLKAIPADAAVVALNVKGKAIDSAVLAERCREWGGDGTRVAFVVGGAAGIAPAVLERARFSLSLSTMTFTHELARIVLLEQIYRAMTITAGKTYHY